MSEDIEKKRRVRRTKTTIERDVIAAVTSLIEEVGFANVTLTGVAQRAQIEATVFYRRYENLEKLFDQYTRRYDYWLGNLAEAMPSGLDYEAKFKWILRNMTVALYRNKGMQQLLIWELSNDNPVTRRTTHLRESMNESLIKLMETIFEGSGIDMNTITAMLIAGIYYIILIRKRTTFCLIDYSTRAGKDRLLEAIDQIGCILFSELRHRQEMQLFIEKLKAEGVSDDLIQRCLPASTEKNG